MTTSAMTGSQFRQALQGAQVRVLQIIHIFLGAGVLALVGIILALYVTTEAVPRQPGSDGFLRILTLVSTVFFLTSLPISHLLFASFFRKQLHSGTGQAPPLGEDYVNQIMGKIRTAFIVRSAILEGSAFMGGVVCLVAVNNGWLRQQPLYWVNILPAAAFVAFTALTVPTADSLERLFVHRILGRGY